jgi:HAMP domain-containing protein
VTLRSRLTAAFLAVVLVPVLLGAIFVGATVAAVGRSRSVERLDAAVAGVRTAIGLRCQRLHTAAEVAAMLGGTSPQRPSIPGPSASATQEPTPGDTGTPATPGSGRPGEAAQRVVERQLAAGVIATTVAGSTSAVAGRLPQYPWVDCAAPASGHGPPGQRVRPGGVSSRVEIHNANGDLVGYVTAVDAVDGALIGALAAAGEAEVSIVGGGATLSTEGGNTEEVAGVARSLPTGTTGETERGRYVRRLDPEPEQPLTLALSIEPGDTPGLYAVLVGVVLAAGLMAIVTAWLLARTTTRPLTELAIAVDRVASGDLAATVPVRGRDEVGRLGTTFNRMTREMRGYVQALTASRDQLRGQLGVLGDTLSSTHDLNRILQVILQTATAATGAQAGIVLLVDPTTGMLVGQCAEGLVDRGFFTAVTDLPAGRRRLLGSQRSQQQPL